jgi:signal transduction histidine kinase
MLGNVAHDLRTPLQAFQSELELLRDNVQDVTNDKARLLRSMTQLDRICHFMNMTINRSIDFTKASSGIKLNYSIESINFSETLNWAVGCMVKSHSKVPIVVSPIPASIHNQIYTDKQWLMENMLCLLSNAQKFTTEGEIRIRCSLQSPLEGGVAAKAESPTESGGIELKKERSSCSVDDEVLDIESGVGGVEEVAPMLVIEVEDTGIGITKENQERLFKPFMQVRVILAT